ncbi:MAG: nickel pincer cofactor biosynthesis protein LarC [Thermoplasmata archaeon]|nr:nickel pincer cofactor biosynthesis protein LarC [Thermoplasmata archaeon]
MDGMLYFECSSGISGDMAVAAMIDLGADTDGLMRVLEGLHVDGFRVEITQVEKSGIRARDFAVILEEDNHDHDAEYLYGEGHHHHHHHGHHRHYGDIVSIVEGSALNDNAKSIALRILRILGEAESEAHGVPLEEVHFHEVGAVDSIVDIVSLAYCLDNLGFDRVCFSELYDGTGMIRCQHGLIPVPVPAVVNIASAHDLPLRITESKGEYVTPTGAAFAAAARTCEVPRSFVISKVGIGAGKRESERAGILRAMIVSPRERTDVVVKLECNMDDCTGEALGYTMERLFAAGAREVNYSPVYMKKNRPGWLLTVICRPDRREEIERVIFRETTTIGIRRTEMERTVLDRESVTVDTEYGAVDVKVSSADGVVRLHPEYEQVAGLSRDRGVAFREVYEAALAAYRRLRFSRGGSGRS